MKSKSNIFFFFFDIFDHKISHGHLKFQNVKIWMYLFIVNYLSLPTYSTTGGLCHPLWESPA